MRIGELHSEIRGRIFIVGTGRSGTTRLREVIGLHPLVYSIPSETHFISDPDGLEDLSRSLSIHHTPERADLALKRFDNLLRRELCGQADNAYAGWRLHKVFGEDHYLICLNDFVSQLIDYEFEGLTTIEATSLPWDRRWPSQAIHYRRTIGRHFKERSEIVRLCRWYVDRLFSGPTRTNDRFFWCEQTPSNLTSLPFLYELFPDATVVHITRDPRAVALSLTRQPWGPKNIDHAVTWVVGLLDRWLKLRREFDFKGRRYCEVKLEDLSRDAGSTFDIICHAAGIPQFEPPSDAFSEKISESWRSSLATLTPQAARRLEPYVAELGYS